MESRSRLSIICSHLLPHSPSPTSRLSSSLTSSASINDAAGDTGNHQLDCVFCRIVRGESPAFKLYEDETCLCILDTSPVSPGHSLIIPKSHFSCLEATPPSVVAAMCSKVPSIGNAIMKANGYATEFIDFYSDFSLSTLNFQTHIHIIPRKARDCLWTTEFEKASPEF
uniref:HIT domain-containing protein n=1 Tax=Salix viminalis TaxID=40686 RepID=A0A6N2LGD0_SALVM